MENIIEIAKKIESNKGRLYLVGGAVRDKLMNFYIYNKGVKYRIFSETIVKKGEKILVINPLLTWTTEDLETFNRTLTSVLFLPKKK